MTLDELVRSWFISIEGIAGKMAKYAGSPAIFLQAAPSDTQPGWDSKEQYPRIVNTVEMRADTERKSQGVLRVDLYCDLAYSTPEEIEPLVRTSLKDIVLQPEDDSPFCFAWARSDAFELESQNSDKRIAGYELLFDILEFPEQITTEPDPVETMNLWVKKEFPDIFVLGIDAVGQYQVATEDAPILYVRMMQYENDHTTMALAWINARLAIHVIAPTAGARSKWVRCIANLLNLSGEAIMPDESPMRFTGIQAVNAADYLTSGQIILSTQYTLPRYQEDTGVLREIPGINPDHGEQSGDRSITYDEIDQVIAEFDD